MSQRGLKLRTWGLILVRGLGLTLLTRLNAPQKGSPSKLLPSSSPPSYCTRPRSQISPTQTNLASSKIGLEEKRPVCAKKHGNQHHCTAGKAGGTILRQSGGAHTPHTPSVGLPLLLWLNPELVWWVSIMRVVESPWPSHKNTLSTAILRNRIVLTGWTQQPIIRWQWWQR